MSADDILLGIEPKSSTLDFNLEEDKTFADMTLTNASSTAVVYKVKTTHPNWYVVRPNRGFLGAGESKKLNVELLTENKESVLQKYVNNRTRERCDKHRFMVESKILPDTYDYNKIELDDQEQQAVHWQSQFKRPINVKN